MEPNPEKLTNNFLIFTTIKMRKIMKIFVGIISYSFTDTMNASSDIDFIPDRIDMVNEGGTVLVQPGI